MAVRVQLPSGVLKGKEALSDQGFFLKSKPYSSRILLIIVRFVRLRIQIEGFAAPAVKQPPQLT